jgi:hypothetical protein
MKKGARVDRDRASQCIILGRRASEAGKISDGYDQVTERRIPYTIINVATDMKIPIL